MKNLIFILVLLTVFAACSPCKRLARKCPPEIVRYDSLVFRDTIIYRDRIVEIEIPADTTTRGNDISSILASTYIDGDKELNIAPINVRIPPISEAKLCGTGSS
jgi:hypothetical protein